jgi:hypothetical protein
MEKKTHATRERFLEAFVYPWLIPLTYRLARLVDRVRWCRTCNLAKSRRQGAKRKVLQNV